jgi:hypothetical protein
MTSLSGSGFLLDAPKSVPTVWDWCAAENAQENSKMLLCLMLLFSVKIYPVAFFPIPKHFVLVDLHFSMNVNV